MDAAAEVFGDLTVQVVRGINLQNLRVFGTSNPFVLVKMKSSNESFTTAVRENDANPSWNDTFTFRNVSSTDGLQISLMEKEGNREGIVSVGGFLPSTLWGFPGIGGGERMLQVAMPSVMNDLTDLGTIVLKLQYRAQLKFRPPLGVLATAAAKTSVFTDKTQIDLLLDKVLNLLCKPVSIAGGVAKRMTKAQKIVCGGGTAAVSTAIGGGVFMAFLALAVPVFFLAILFLPLTFMGGIFLATAMVVMMPVVLALGWVVFCSRPVQCRVWMPSLFWVMSKWPLVRKALLQPPSSQHSGTEQ